jgi:hypothetical protein
MENYISKKASISDAAQKWAETVWHFDEGPFENIIRLLPMAAIPWLGSLGSVIGFALIQVAKYMLGIDLQELGREIDKAFGLGPGDDPRGKVTEEDLENFLNERVEQKKKATILEYGVISKRASLSKDAKRSRRRRPRRRSRYKSRRRYFGKGGLIATVVKGIFKIIAAMGSMYIFSHLGSLYEKHVEKDLSDATKPVRKKIREEMEIDIGSEDFGKKPKRDRPSLLELTEPSDKRLNKTLDELEEKYGL